MVSVVATWYPTLTGLRIGCTLVRMRPAHRSVGTFLAVLLTVILGGIAFVLYVHNGSVTCGTASIPLHLKPGNPFCQPYVDAGQNREIGLYLGYVALAILVITFASRAWLLTDTAEDRKSVV